MASKSFFWGIVVIPMYEYRCVLTCAQIELLTIDKPVINYLTGKDKKGKAKSPKRPTKQEVEKVTQKWEDKYKDGHKPVINLAGFKIKK